MRRILKFFLNMQFKEDASVKHKELENEQTSHSIMLREIQKMLNDERSKTVSLQSQVRLEPSI